MSIRSRKELEVTREKLRWLESEHETLSQQPSGNAHARELTLRSLKAMMNQLREEITRFEHQAKARV